MQSAANTQDLVDIRELREGTVVLANGSYRQVVMVGGINFALKSEAEQNTIAAGYQNFLNALDFPVQILVHSRKINIERYLVSLNERKQQEVSPLLQNQITEYQEFVRSFVQTYAIMKKMFFVVVPFYPSTLPGTASLTGVLSVFKRKPKQEAAKQAAADTEAGFRENVSQLKQRVDEVVGGLQTIGLEATVLDDEALVQLFYNFYNPDTTEREHVETPGGGEAKPA